MKRVYGDELTQRERQVAALIAEGMTNAEIAAHLFVSIKTVKSHVQHALAKCYVRNRTQLAVTYKQQQPPWLRPPY